MLVKTLLNRMERFKSFVFGKTWVTGNRESPVLNVEIRPRKNSRPECPVCGRKRPVYDTQAVREFEHLPIWFYRVMFRYAPRRVDCPYDGVWVEWMPWADGKEQMTSRYKLYLARWARRLSWSETARVFETSWGCVFRAVQSAVELWAGPSLSRRRDPDRGG